MFGSIFSEKGPLGQGRGVPYRRASLGMKPGFNNGLEPPLRELLNDHITLKLMASDRVTVEELHAFVRSAQARLRSLHTDEPAG